MDDETRAALDLTDDQLRSMRDAAEPGVVAKRSRDLNQRAKSTVDRAVTLEERQGVRLRAVASGTTATTTTEVHDSVAGTLLVDRVEDEPVSASAYRVG